MERRVVGLARGDSVSALGSNYDLMVATIGYESRAVHAARLLGQRCTRVSAAGFLSPHALHYDANRAWYIDQGYLVAELADREYRGWIRSSLEDLSGRDDQARVLIDISSMSRIRIAEAASAVWDLGGKWLADFVYTPALYDPPPPDDQPIVVCEPVTPRLAGWSAELGLATAAIVGLGYEQDKAVGALEYLEPADVWGFAPRGHVGQYDDDVEVANSSFWSFNPQPIRVDYDVFDPFAAYEALESLAYGLTPSRRLVLVPFGPKVFALNAILVALAHDPSVAVWRVSAGDLETPVDRRPGDSIVGIRVVGVDVSDT